MSGAGKAATALEQVDPLGVGMVFLVKGSGWCEVRGYANNGRKTPGGNDRCKVLYTIPL